MAASIVQLDIISQGDLNGNTRLLSYSVLVVFFHLLFELRINKSFCKYVTIIQRAVVEIRVFFLISALGIVAFTLAMTHLLHACPLDGCTPDPDADDFPTHFLEQSRPFAQNVLITLINVAFNKGDDNWRLTWIESRLRFIEAAENMSHQVPGFRNTLDLFPKEIYFSATEKEVECYNAKNPSKKSITRDDAEDNEDKMSVNQGENTLPLQILLLAMDQIQGSILSLT
ncbi:hypothetical protein BGX26_012042 [Mortierella sp. AD094]|nr:hypothetical protein BGX26_012042 [Mortierella sp. AD094]